MKDNNKEYTINAKDVDLSYNTKKVVDEAYNLTRQKSYLSNVMTNVPMVDFIAEGNLEKLSLRHVYFWRICFGWRQ